MQDFQEPGDLMVELAELEKKGANSEENGSGAILLISCYELGQQPLGLVGLAGFLEEEGYRRAPQERRILPWELNDRKKTAIIK